MRQTEACRVGGAPGTSIQAPARPSCNFPCSNQSRLAVYFACEHGTNGKGCSMKQSYGTSRKSDDQENEWISELERQYEDEEDYFDTFDDEEDEGSDLSDIFNTVPNDEEI
jgi:hypothetical protein